MATMRLHKSGFFLIFLAYLILQVHAIVPHHHHAGQACMMVNHHCGDKTRHPGQEDPIHQHDHGEMAECLLNQAALIPAQETRKTGELCQPNGCSDDKGRDHPLAQVSLSTLPDHDPQATFLPPPDNTPANAALTSRCQGTRAPPAC